MAVHEAAGGQVKTSGFDGIDDIHETLAVETEGAHAGRRHADTGQYCRCGALEARGNGMASRNTVENGNQKHSTVRSGIGIRLATGATALAECGTAHDVWI